MPYQWIKFLHVVSAVGFVAAHGMSIGVLFAIRREQDRRRLLAILDVSRRTAAALYVALIAVVATGFWLGWSRSSLFEERWYWVSLVVLAVTSSLMLAVAKPFTTRLRLACDLRPSGVPRKSDAELAELIRSPRVHLIATIGAVGLLTILWLMVLKPDLGAGSDRPATTPTTMATTTTGATTVPEGGSTTSTAAPTTTLSGEEAQLALGKEIYEDTVGCSVCHGIDGGGTAEAPRIAGRGRDDIADALRWAAPMTDIRLSPEQLNAVGLYVSRLGR